MTVKSEDSVAFFVTKSKRKKMKTKTCDVATVPYVLADSENYRKQPITIIAAMGNHRVIGCKNQLPWHLPADLQHFKKLTLHKAVIMGRKTHESIGKILPGRQHIVITTDENYKIPAQSLDNLPINTSVVIAHSLTEALHAVKHSDEIMIIGGSSLFKEALSIATTLYLTYIHADFEGDTFFPEFDNKQWQLIEREDHVADNKNPYDYSFVTLKRC